jgi:hypothetical protein
MPEQPRKLYEKTSDTGGGMRVSVRAMTFSASGTPRSAVTLVVATTKGWFTVLPDDAGAATALMSSADARDTAVRLVEAAAAADAAAPGLLD